LAPPSGERGDAVGFIRAIRGLHEEIQDLSLVFEGVHQFVGPPDLLAGVDGGADSWKWSFQGNLLFRKDGATLLDNYTRRIAPELTLVHRIESLLNGRYEVISLNPDQKLTRAPVESFPSDNPAVLNKPESPFRIIYIWYFRSLSDDEAAHFEHQGWEDVVGARCLKLRWVTDPAQSAGRIETYWIDLERSGHPLKVEWHDGPNLLLRTHEIELKSFPSTSGKSIWLPVSGITDTFLWEGKYYDSPISRQTTVVASGTVRLNQGLPDHYFSAKHRGEIPGSDAPNPLRQAFDDEAANPSAPRLRTDRVSVQERLDRGLTEADRQARMIEASSSARQAWSLSTTLQILFVSVGLATIIAGGLALRRGRA
jgi:hypothetical protein